MTAEQDEMWMAVAIECAAVEKIGVLKLIEKLKERFMISEKAALSPATDRNQTIPEGYFIHEDCKVSPAKQEQQGWIHLDERKPEYMECVIVCTKFYGYITEGQYGGDGNQFSVGGEWRECTHWMPLPERPVPALPYTEEK